MSTLLSKNFGPECVLSVDFEGHRAEPLTGLLRRASAPKGRPNPRSPSVCVGCLFFKVTEPSPLQDSFGVRQKGDRLGPPPRSPSSRIHCCPGGLYRGPIARVGVRPELFPGIGVLPGPATESYILNRGTQ